MKAKNIKYIFMLCCLFLFSFHSYAEDRSFTDHSLNAGKYVNSTKSDIQQLEQNESSRGEKIENTIKEIGGTVDSQEISTIGLMKDKLTIDTIIESYDKIKGIKIKREIIPPGSKSKTSLKDTIKETSLDLGHYLYKFLKYNFVYLLILLILFLLLHKDNERRRKLNGCLQSRCDRPKDKKHQKGCRKEGF